MEEKDREISALRLIYDEEKKELDRLEAYFEKLMAERAAALAIERQKAEQRAREAAQLATLSKAATMLQKIWRGSQGRKAAEKGKAGKGKGKKKKVREVANGSQSASCSTLAPLSSCIISCSLACPHLNSLVLADGTRDLSDVDATRTRPYVQ